MTNIYDSPIYTLTMTLINNLVYLLDIITFTKLNKIKMLKNYFVASFHSTLSIWHPRLHLTQPSV